ncbi:hypothetical protein PLICRDRAFT_115782 [Plicaturopsis crispa FD-325 SS-3]|nr:hypothetical protein PLICRDRAFT_115782 [Plicaturopsis crispa FD-325 SS-3]
MDPISPHVGNAESPPLRSTGTILGSFLRGRPRAPSQSAAPQLSLQQHDIRDLSPSPPAQTPPSPGATGHRRRPAAATPGIQASLSHNTPPSLGIGSMLRRRRSAGTIASGNPPVAGSSMNPPPAATNGASVARSVSLAPSNGVAGGLPSHRIRLVPHLDSRRSLRFEPICRDLKEGDPALRIGRFTDRSGLGLAAANALGSNKLAFKSKVVSRAHAEVWVEAGGRFFVKDTKSSSGTFLNHVRLAPANAESRPHQLRDGDILQLGVDYQGGTEDIYKSVRIRIEVGREWQSAANAFNTNAIKQLKSLAVSPAGADPSKVVMPKSNIPDCCICLFSVTIRQALFIAPCSHAFHYKCIRPLLETHHPAFSCPLCRTFADLEDDVEVEAATADDIELDDAPPPMNAAERERAEAGAETEVEADAVPRRRGGTVMHTVIDLTEPAAEDHDHEMLDAADDDDADADADADARSGSVSPDVMASGSGSGAGAGPARPADDSSEGEGTGSMDEGPGSGGEGGEGTVGGKRKR